MFSIRSQGRVDIPRAAKEHRSSKSTSLGEEFDEPQPYSPTARTTNTPRRVCRRLLLCDHGLGLAATGLGLQGS